MNRVETNPTDQYRALRRGCGLVDYSAVGFVRVSGAVATDFLGEICTRSTDFLLEGQISAALMLRENGLIVSEVLIYRSATDYLVEIWPDQARVAVDHLLTAAEGVTDLDVTDASDQYAAYGVEGPAAGRIAAKFLPFPVASMAYGSFVVTEDGLAARIGVTGEYGYKFVVPAAKAADMHDQLVVLGAPDCGRAVLDVCRMEARYVNLERESGGAEVTPFEVGLQWLIDFEHDFVGREALLVRWNNGLEREPVCWVADEGLVAPPARGSGVVVDDTEVGMVTHAVHSPSLARVIGTALVDSSVAASGLDLGLAAPKLAIRTISAPFLVPRSFRMPLA
ncbi:aminomethyltransferase [Longimycelium tulufanense]|uniref:Aminomethyltransferase n=1 Tax=Longimycelium tulufanense TaxID=907463 RepID=A0A8J3C719_9PSEU|nr:aminomethyl transferase family protein [Longimycelium tulufanense]GGM46317.1 aminomethyltransferase [Longimycelium tulufanense]